jgi:hypothetical protein
MVDPYDWDALREFLADEPNAVVELIAHLGKCVKRGGPSNFRNFLPPQQAELYDLVSRIAEEL